MDDEQASRSAIELRDTTVGGPATSGDTALAAVLPPATVTATAGTPRSVLPFDEEQEPVRHLPTSEAVLPELRWPTPSAPIDAGSHPATVEPAAAAPELVAPPLIEHDPPRLEPFAAYGPEAPTVQDEPLPKAVAPQPDAVDTTALDVALSLPHDAPEPVTAVVEPAHRSEPIVVESAPDTPPPPPSLTLPTIPTLAASPAVAASSVAGISRPPLASPRAPTVDGTASFRSATATVQLERAIQARDAAAVPPAPVSPIIEARATDRIGSAPATSAVPPISLPRLPIHFSGIWRWTKAIAFYAAIAVAAWLMVVLGQIVLYRTVDPPFSNLMLFNRLSGDVVVQKWLPIEQVPAQLIRAIVVSEDGRFCSHRGIDLKELEVAIERAKDGVPRGASTISMQVTKNLFLWPGKNYIRKALEIPLTLVIEALWTKRRIFEVYVNIAEWGPGIFGAEAAAGYHFGKSASRVSEKEAALLAVALPNPVARDAGDPGPGTERLANTIQARMRAMSRAASCVERKPRDP